jgi:predicted ATPase
VTLAVAPITRIAVTGGPGGGKTTVWRLLASLHPARVHAVPEVATALFRHVFPAVESAAERCAVQCAIFRVQEQLEAFFAARCADGQLLLCDRGTPDGGGYWPDGHEAFFAAMGTRWDDQLARYDAVLFLETAAVGGYAIDEGNETRRESLAAAVEIDRRLHAVWARHPRFVHVPHEPDFAVKLARAETALQALLAGS